MKVYRFWAKHTEPGERFPVTCWGGSNESESDARRQAAERARAVVGRIRAGDRARAEYEYGQRGLREEVVREITADGGRTLGAITRNRYGALVLNATRTFFADLDDPAPARTGLLARLFSKRRPVPDSREQVVGRVTAAVERAPGLGLRLYRTCAGHRALVTTREYEPGADDAHDLLRQLGSDPLYARLCENQECFRARLTPKPWRCGVEPPPLQYPFENDADEARYRAWEQRYDERALPYATCSFVGTFGSTATNPAVAPLVELHDTWTVGEGTLA